MAAQCLLHHRGRLPWKADDDCQPLLSGRMTRLEQLLGAELLGCFTCLAEAEKALL